MDIYDSQLKKHPMAYINYLQQQNRVKKQSELQDKEKIINKQKEEAFNLYLQGANEKRVDNQRKREKISKLREKSVGANSRKQWGAESKPIIRKVVLNKFHPDAFSYEDVSIRSVSQSTQRRGLAEPDEKIESIKTLLSNFSEKQLLCVQNFLDNLLS